jgi:two-component system, sensor histidine kinase and response regulator
MYKNPKTFSKKIQRILAKGIIFLKMYVNLVSGVLGVYKNALHISMIAKRKILVVDDNAGNRLLLQYNLEGHFDIDFASNGFSAVEKFKESKYDLILMDIHMPDLDGLETTAQIRQLEAGITRTPIFAVTSNMFREQKEKCLQAGMDDYIIKPIHAKALIDRINHFFNSSLAAR